MTLFQKDPNATLDYKRDWAVWLAPFGDTILTSAWIVPAGLTKGTDTSTSTTATVWLSGGTAGQSYDVVNRVVTTQGRTDDRTMQIVVRER